jgi:two-component system, OmpR family, heavy metal sensor histidine kinase CusS
VTTSASAPYSLGLRLTSMFAFQTLLGFGTLSLVIYLAAAWNLSAKAEAELGRKSELVHHLVSEASESGDTKSMRHKLDEFFARHEGLQVDLSGPSGQPVYASAERVSTGARQRAAQFALPSTGQTPIASARITLDLSDDQRFLQGLAALLVLSTLLGASAVSFTGFWLVRRALAPLRGLAERTRTIRIDKPGQRLALDPPVQELQPFVHQFNELLERLEYTCQELEAFNADVAHELRTPLASIIGQTEVALSRQRGADELHATLGSNLEEVRRLSAIVNDMLFLARADRGAEAMTSTEMCVLPLLHQVLDFYDGALADRSLSARIEGAGRAAFEPGLIRRAVSNLLSNAMRYAAAGTDILISARKEGNSVWIEVTNVGQTVPETALPRLFDRFFRGHPAREGSNENHGLGLAIVAAIARMHGGSTSARSEAGLTTIGFSLVTTPVRQPAGVSGENLPAGAMPRFNPQESLMTSKTDAIAHSDSHG